MINRNTIAFWIRAVIDDTCRTASEDDCKTVKAEAYEICSIGSPLLFRKKFAD